MNISQYTVQRGIIKARNNHKQENTMNTHSTDTEPEVENDQTLGQFHATKVTIKNDSLKLINENNDCNHKNSQKNVFDAFVDDLPSYEYDQRMLHKNQLIKKKREKTKNCKQLDLLDTNNNRFFNYYEAFLYIAEHCQKNGQRFTKETCKEYLKKCYILDFAHDNFIPIMTHLTQKLFNKYFRLAQRELKFL